MLGVPEEVFKSRQKKVVVTGRVGQVVMPMCDGAHLGMVGGGRSDGDVGPLIDIQDWEGLSKEALVGMAQQLFPTGQLAEAISYAGSDLVAASTLPDAELALLYQPPMPEFVAGQGFANSAFWEEVAGPNVEVGQWIKHGYSEWFPRYGQVPVIVRANNKNTEQHRDFVTEETAGLLATGAVRDVTAQRADPEVVRVVAPLTVAVQGSGKKRLCWNGRPINEFLPHKHFKFEHAEQAARMMRPGDFMFTIDMKSGYHQVPLKAGFRKFCCFEWEGRVYQWQVLPFGLSTGPRVYSKLTRRLLQRWRAKGVRCSNYIDDFIFFASSMQQALAIRAMVLADLQAAGWYISPSKSMLVPGTMVKYLGLLFCSLPRPHLRVPVEKVERVKASFRGILNAGEAKDGSVTVRGETLCSVLGFLQSLRLAVALVPVFTRELYLCMNSQLPRDLLGVMEYGQAVTLSRAAVKECALWAGCIERWNGFVVQPQYVSRVLYTDGSGGGYGAMVHRVSSRVIEPALDILSGAWEAGVDKASVVTELLGLWRALVGAGQELVDQVVLHRTDNICTSAVIARGGSRTSDRLTAIVRRIMVYCLMHNITLASQYVGAGVIINSGADALSRQNDHSDCQLNSAVFGRLWRLWGPFVVDMFASSATAQRVYGSDRRLPYWSLFADGLAKDVDALSASWEVEGSKGTLYAFPPVALVGETIQRVVAAGVRAVVVMPMWPAQWWWPLVLEHAVMPDFLLGFP